MTDNVAQIGLARDPKHNYFLDGNGPIVSVTTVLKIVDKSGPLVGWAKRITAEAAIDHRADLDKWVEMGGRDGAVGFLTKAATTLNEQARVMGSDVHGYAEAISRGQDVDIPDELQPFVVAYRAWVTDFAPEFLAAEEMVCSVTHGYAGTLDAIARIAGETWLIDYKTSKGVYAETALQLAAYGHAEFIGRPGDPMRYAIPPIDQYGVLHLRPEGYELVPFTVDASTFEAFLSAKRLTEWKSGSIVGAPVGPALLKFPAPAKEAVA
jgi:hypothetical protein